MGGPANISRYLPVKLQIYLVTLGRHESLEAEESGLTILAVNSPEDAALDVVFVHGLDGDARATWCRNMPDSFWPSWLAQDLSRVAIWSLGYDAWSSGWRGRAMAIPDRATNLLAQLQNSGIGKRPVCFVTHSMGGLLVKEMLVQAAEKGSNFASVAKSANGVVFLSTPHSGSGLTKAVEAISQIYRSTLAIDDLKQNNAQLRRLGDRYRDWSAEVGLRNLVMFETHATKGVRVVDEASANPGLARVHPIPVDSNHIDICKPVDRDSIVYGQVKHFIEGILHAVEATEDPRIQCAGNSMSSKDDLSSAAQGRRVPLSIPISELNPFALEIHPAISIGANVEDLPTLPHYVERAHDVRLRQLVQSIVAGKNGLAVLVGSSSSGKTRAAWEAVRQLPKSWSLWHPLAPAQAEAVLDGIDEISPQTVIWLNELQNYLLTSSPYVGEEVAARLRTLLRDSSRAPILILGTIWPEYLATILSIPAAGKIDTHSQARALVANTEIGIPSAFSPDEIRAADKTGDPRLRQALGHSKSGEITQYLAGGPALLQRLATAPAAAQAVVKVAIDAHRLGYTANLSRSFLERATPGYLSDNEWLALKDDWLDQALEYTGEICRGAVGLLVRYRLQPGQGTEDQAHFRLADYIAQWGRKARCFDVPPSQFWESALAHLATADELTSLGDAAAARWRIHYAKLLYERAIAMGSSVALLRMGELEETCGNLSQALEYFLRGASAGHVDAQLKLADNLSDLDELADAKKWLRVAADRGDYRAMQSLAQIAESDGDESEAVALLQVAVGLAGINSSGPLRQLERLEERLGHDAKAEVLREQSRAGVQTFMRRSLKDIAERSGGIAALKQQCLAQVSEAQAAGETADIFHLELLAEIHEEEGELLDAEAVADSAAEQGSQSALLGLVAKRLTKGNRREAERLALKAANAGDSYGLHELARCSPKDSRLQRIMKFGLEPDGKVSN